MIDFDKIPKSTYDELVAIYGKEQAENYIKSVNYNFSTIGRKIHAFYLVKSFRKYKWKLLVGVVILIVWFTVNYWYLFN